MLDVVRFSAMTVEQQISYGAALAGLVNASLVDCGLPIDQAERAEDVLTVPTGDGWAICFLDSRRWGMALHCAQYVQKGAASLPTTLDEFGKKMPPGVRIGITTGWLVIYRAEGDPRQAAAGTAIIKAERVMSAGDQQHILCDAEVMNRIKASAEWRRFSRTLAEEYQVSDKHRNIYHVYSVHGQGDHPDTFVGNTDVPGNIMELAKRYCALRARMSHKNICWILGIDPSYGDWLYRFGLDHFPEAGFWEPSSGTAGG